MKSRLQLCVLVLFIYVAVVNVMIVRQLLARLHARAEKMGTNVSVEQAPVRTDVDLALRRARPASCHPTREWVVCVVAERTGTNQRIGGLLETMGHLAYEGRVEIMLVATPENFEPYHREWCQRVTPCRLVLAEDSRPATVFSAVRAQALCASSVLLVGQHLRIDNFFVARLRETTADRVSCLAVAVGRVTGKEQATCPVLAFRVPWFFLHTQPARLADISQTAVRMGVLGTSVRAVHLG